MRISLTLLFFFVLSIIPAFGQGTQVEFGKNRVQFHNDFEEWLMYETPNFITYWYGEGRNIGEASVLLAEYDYEEILSILEHRINEKIEIIVYTDITDLKQTNLGSEEAFNNSGGRTKIVGNKIFIHFNGDHQHLRRQIREGVASVYMDAMLFGSNLQEIVQNAVMMNLPAWFKDGLVSYIGEEWTVEDDNLLRDIFVNGNYQNNFEKFAEDYPKLAGHSMWYFIAQNYGKNTVSNLLYLTRINRSIESGFLYVLGTSFDKTVDGWNIYFSQRYKKEITKLEEPTGKKVEFKNKRKLPITQMKLSPDGTQLAYVTNEIGNYKVYLQDVRSGDRQVIHKGGFRNAFQSTDYNYPLVAWNPSGFELAIMYEKRDVVSLLIYDKNTKEKTTEELAPHYQRVYSMDYVDNNNLIISAAVRGYSDLFIYKTRTRQTERITNDFYDDKDAVVVKLDNKKGVLFSSNRTGLMLEQMKLDTILPIENFDLYFYDYESGSKELVQVTNTPLFNEMKPAAVDSTYFTYLTDESGVINRGAGYLEEYIAYYEKIITLKDGTEFTMHRDSALASVNIQDSTLIVNTELRPVMKKRAFTHNTSNYNYNILDQHTSPRSNKQVELVYSNKNYYIYIDSLNPEKKVSASLTRFRQQSGVKSESTDDRNTDINNELKIITIDENGAEEIPRISANKKDTAKVDIDNYLFQSEFDHEEAPPVEVASDEEVVSKIKPQKKSTIAKSKEKKVHKFRRSRIVPYRLKFRTDFVTSTLDNSLLFGGLDSYAGLSPQSSRNSFAFPAPGVLMKANFKDLFEDYELEGGIRLPTTFNGAEYFMIYKDKKKRLDKTYAVYRRALRFNDEAAGSFFPNRNRESIFLGMMQVKYPLDIFRSLRATGTLRFDKNVQLATDRNTLGIPTERQQRFGLRLEYVFDNTLDVSLNIKNGTRYKISVEGLKRFEVDVANDFSFNFNKGVMGVVGYDARHYQRLGKHSVLAFRAAGSASFGSERILYTLGGIDGWLFSSTNNDIPFPTGDNFAYQTLAANLRGFRLNIRNGSNYALFNTELRVPIFKYLKKNIRNSFFRHFQATAFFDVGTAWQGLTPFDEENPLNTVNISNPPTVDIQVNYFRDPIVAGYGVGARSVLFGYFIKFDYAYGIETRVVQDPRFYLSLGMDF